MYMQELIHKIIKRKRSGHRETVQWFGALNVLTEAPDLISSTHTRWLTAACDSSFRDPTPSDVLDYLCACDTYIEAHAGAHRYT